MGKELDADQLDDAMEVCADVHERTHTSLFVEGVADVPGLLTHAPCDVGVRQWMLTVTGASVWRSSRSGGKTATTADNGSSAVLQGRCLCLRVRCGGSCSAGEGWHDCNV